MPFQLKTDSGTKRRDAQARVNMILGVLGFVGPFVTFFLAISTIGYNFKIAGLVSVAVVYLIICVWSYNRPISDSGDAVTNEVSADRAEIASDIQGKLLALGEANQFFGSSLNPQDIFRLVSSRVGEICPFVTSALFVYEDDRTKLQISLAEGKNAGLLKGVRLAADAGLAGLAALSREVETDDDLMLEMSSLPVEVLDGLTSAVAIPLIHEGEVFGIYQLYSDAAMAKHGTANLFQAIGEQVAPLFRSSMAFEKSVASALTDVLTGLPNERAFYMILENQLAESLRFRTERPLSILSIDIRDFAEVNAMLGHGAGDRMLQFAGKTIGESLRKMDFLARVINDEFSVILPTASEKTAAEVIERIREGFSRSAFEVDENDRISISLNIGWATFWKDGETAAQLIRSAQLRKRQSKSEASAEVLLFPKEYVN